MRLESIIRFFKRRDRVENEKKEIPGIYDVPESDDYKKPGIDKKLAKEILLTYGSPEMVKDYEEITGRKLDE